MRIWKMSSHPALHVSILSVLILECAAGVRFR
jgi:hypothetical protein